MKRTRIPLRHRVEFEEDKHEGHLKKYAPSHTEDLILEEDQTTTYEASSELTEANNTNALEGYIYDAVFTSSKDEDNNSQGGDIKICDCLRT